MHNQPVNLSHKKTWLLLAAWLTYSLGALGWYVAENPLLFKGLC